MFDIAPTELLVIAVVALVIIGPKDLPKVMRTVGNWVGRARGMARHFRSGLDTMMREAELEEMEKKWKADNERIMREHPQVPGEERAAPPAQLREWDSTPPVDKPLPPSGKLPSGKKVARSVSPSKDAAAPLPPPTIPPGELP